MGACFVLSLLALMFHVYRACWLITCVMCAKLSELIMLYQVSQDLISEKIFGTRIFINLINELFMTDFAEYCTS